MFSPHHSGLKTYHVVDQNGPKLYDEIALEVYNGDGR